MPQSSNDVLILPVSRDDTSNPQEIARRVSSSSEPFIRLLIEDDQIVNQQTPEDSGFGPFKSEGHTLVIHPAITVNSATGVALPWPRPYQSGRSGRIDFLDVLYLHLPASLSGLTMNRALLQSILPNVPHGVDLAWYIALSTAADHPVLFSADLLVICPPHSRHDQKLRVQTLQELGKALGGLKKAALADQLRRMNEVAANG